MDICYVGTDARGTPRTGRMTVQSLPSWVKARVSTGWDFLRVHDVVTGEQVGGSRGLTWWALDESGGE